MIIGILMLVFYSKSRGREDSAKMQATANLAAQLHDACNQWKLRQGSVKYTGISLTELISSGLWDTNKQKTPFDTNLTVGVNGADASKVDLSFAGIPSSLTTSLTNLLKSRGFAAVASGNNIVITQ